MISFFSLRSFTSKIGGLTLFPFAIIVFTLGFFPSVSASEVYVRTLGATFLDYDPEVVSPSGTVTKTFTRDSTWTTPVSWSWRNYAAAAMGSLAISAREGLSNYNAGTQTHASVRTNAHWTDDITINSPGLTGQSGVMTVTYRVNGYLIFTGTYNQVAGYNRAYLSSTVSFNGQAVDAPYYELSYFGTAGFDFMNANRSIELGFTFGTPFNLKHALRAETAMDSRNPTPGRAEVEAAGIWKGITVKYQGNIVTDFTSSSTTVPVWSQTLPPPLPVLANSAEAGDFVLSWPAQAACDLMESPDLNSWGPSTAAPTVNGMFKTARMPMTQPRAFFQLKSAP